MKKKQRKPTVHLTEELFKKALDGSRGNITLIAQKAGVDRQTVYNYMEAHPECKADIQKERDTLVDYAENQLGVLIKEKNPTAIIFALKTLGKNRGYTEQIMLANADGSNLIPPKIIVKDKDSAGIVDQIMQGD